MPMSFPVMVLRWASLIMQQVLDLLLAKLLGFFFFFLSKPARFLIPAVWFQLIALDSSWPAESWKCLRWMLSMRGTLRYMACLFLCLLSKIAIPHLGTKFKFHFACCDRQQERTIQLSQLRTGGLSVPCSMLVLWKQLLVTVSLALLRYFLNLFKQVMTILMALVLHWIFLIICFLF